MTASSNQEDDIENGAPDPPVRSAPEEDGPTTKTSTTSHSLAPPPTEDESKTTTLANRNDLEVAAAERKDTIEEDEEEVKDDSDSVLEARSPDVEQGLHISDTNNNNNITTTTTEDTRNANVLIVPHSSPSDEDDDEEQQQQPTRMVDMNDFRLRHYLFEESGDGADDPDNNSLSSSLLLDGDNNNSDTINPGCDRCLDITGRLVCIPIALVVTVTTVTTVLAFCVLPSLLLIGTALTLYYCCTREPVPVRVLLRAMLLDENDPTSSMMNGGAAEMAAPRFTKAEIQPYLLRRTCIAIRVNQGSHDDDDKNKSNGNPPHHVDDVPAGGLVVETAEGQLYFSVPLIAEPSSSSSDPDDDNNHNSILLAPEVPDHPEQAHEIELVDFPIRVLQTEANYDDIDASVARAPPEIEETKEEEDHGNTQPPALTVSAAGHRREPEDPLRTISNNHHDMDHSGSPEEDATEAHHERGTACDICLRRYRVGDTLAWSRNPVCNHAYHAECITDWLLHQQSQQQHNRQNNNNNSHCSCPNCRADFLYAEPMAPRRKSASSRRSSRGSGNHHRVIEEPDHNSNNNSNNNNSHPDVPPV